MTFTFSDAQATLIKECIVDAKDHDDYNAIETNGNENSNGNALYFIVKTWAEQRTLL